MNRQTILILAIMTLMGFTAYMYSHMGSQDHNDCFQYHDAQKCCHMGCIWDGSMCHPSDRVLQKHTCPITTNPEVCISSGCQMEGGVCVDIE